MAVLDGPWMDKQIHILCEKKDTCAPINDRFQRPASHTREILPPESERAASFTIQQDPIQA